MNHNCKTEAHNLWSKAHYDGGDYRYFKVHNLQSEAHNDGDDYHCDGDGDGDCHQDDDYHYDGDGDGDDDDDYMDSDDCYLINYNRFKENEVHFK